MTDISFSDLGKGHDHTFAKMFDRIMAKPLKQRFNIGDMQDTLLQDEQILRETVHRNLADKPLFGVPPASDNETEIFYSNGKPFPESWGSPPLFETRDLRPFPCGWGMGSGTRLRWITENLRKDKATWEACIAEYGYEDLHF